MSGYDNPEWSDLSPRLREIAEPARRAVLDERDVILIGPPGAGKTMIARRLQRAVKTVDKMGREIDLIWRLAGLGYDGNGNRRVPTAINQPFRAPHHTVSVAGLTGVSRNPRPGEVHLAHGGVLFLDEAPEFSRAALQAVAVAHREKVTTWHERQSPWIRALPCNFVLVVAMNPCPCGGASRSARPCGCTEAQKTRYVMRLEALQIPDAVTVEIPEGGLQ